MMPHDNELEKAILGGLIRDPQDWREVQDLFHDELFYDPNNKTIARAIVTLKNGNKAVDIVSVVQWIKSQGLITTCEPAYVTSLLSTAALFGFREKVLILNQYYIRRKIILKSHQMISAAEQETCDVLDLLAELEKTTNEIVNKISVGKTYDAQDCHIEMIDHLDKLQKLKPGELIGIDTGFKDLNDFTSGWQKTDLIILAGRPGMGKTSMALNLTQTASQKVPVLFFSLEMGRLSLYARLCSQITSIPLDLHLRQKMDESTRIYWNQNTYNLSQSPIYIDDRGGVDLNYLKAKIRKMKRDKNIGMVVIDHLGLIRKAKNNKSTNDQIGEITADMKTLAKEIDIPIILLCQLNRASEAQADPRPRLKDLRDSGNIEQDADQVIFIFRPEYYDILDDGTPEKNSTIGKAEIIIQKNRNGALDSVFTGFDGKCTNFYDLSKPQFVPHEPKALEQNNDFLKGPF